MKESKHTIGDLRQRQSLPLDAKIKLTKQRIEDWVNEYGEDGVYVSFSRGKDSTVLLHIARSIYPDMKAVFIDTGLEYPEVRNFVKTFENVEWLKPKIKFKEVIEKYGYPMISKEVSRDVVVARNNPDGKTAQKFIRGSDYHKKYGDRWLLEKWVHLINAPFKISNQCCNIMKKTPVHKFNKENGMVPIIGTMACESVLRQKEWLREGCNAFDNKEPNSKPLSFWTEQDVLKYLKDFGMPYPSVYGEILIDDKGKYYTTGCDRTGCMFCGYGCHLEKSPNRFEKMKETHPKQYDYIMRPKEKGGLGYKEVIDWINEHGDMNIKY